MSDGTLYFNSLKKNEIMIYPINPQQYVNEEWIDVSAYLYKNSKWNELLSQLFPSDFNLASYGNKGVAYEVYSDIDGVETVIAEKDYMKHQNWKIKFFTSGTLAALKEGEIDAFLVGGGGGSFGGNDDKGGGGGGGGYTTTAKNLTLNTTNYSIVVGAGGEADTDGGNSTAFNYIANGGKKGNRSTGSDMTQTGGAGGSGGGGGGYSSGYNGGAGGSDGSDGKNGYPSGGKGQGTTTREFGESTGKLYAGGGGGGKHNASQGAGGDGGGASGGTSASANTGGGGGGGNSGSGGSGIVIIRNARS